MPVSYVVTFTRSWPGRGVPVPAGGEERWAARPSAWALPITVAGDLVLIRHPGVLASIGALCAYPDGFLFHLTIGLDPARVASQAVSFHVRTPEERASASRLEVRFSNGKVADSVAGMTHRAAYGQPVLRFSGGSSGICGNSPVARCEGRWWVSPLPPPGPVEFAVLLQGAAGPDGTAVIDASQITSAAAQSETLWPKTDGE